MEPTINVSTVQWMQIATVLLTGLLAGLFYGYDCSVIKGLGNLSDKAYLQSFQSISKEIINPYFFLSFIGSMIVLPIATWLTYKMEVGTSFYLLLIATFVYWIGVFVITGVCNVPLNDLVEQFNISEASEAAIAEMRQKFETEWNLWHHIRTYASIISFLFSIIAAVKRT